MLFISRRSLVRLVLCVLVRKQYMFLIAHIFHKSCPVSTLPPSPSLPWLLQKHNRTLLLFSWSFVCSFRSGEQEQETVQKGGKNGNLPSLFVELMLLVYCLYFSWDGSFEKLVHSTCACLKEGISQSYQGLNETGVFGQYRFVMKKSLSIEAKILLTNHCLSSTCVLVCSGCDSSKGLE